MAQPSLHGRPEVSCGVVEDLTAADDSITDIKQRIESEFYFDYEIPINR